MVCGVFVVCVWGRSRPVKPPRLTDNLVQTEDTRRWIPGLAGDDRYVRVPVAGPTPDTSARICVPRGSFYMYVVVDRDLCT